MTKKNIMPVVVLTVICIVVAVLLAVVNYFAAPEIKKNADLKVSKSLEAVFPENTGFDEIKLSDYKNVPSTVTKAYKEKSGAGHVVVLETSTSYTSGAKMSITVGIDSNGAIKGISLNQYSETKDFGKETYPKTFVGLKASDVDTSNNNLLVSGVTFSSKAFKSAIKDAFNLMIILDGGEIEPEAAQTPAPLPRTDAEILALATELVGQGATFDDVTPDGTKYARKMYKEKNGNGFVAYVLVMSQYGTPETETLVHIGNDGKIVNVKKLLWKTSDAMYGYEPPTQEQADAFYAELPGKDALEIANYRAEDAELVSNATRTSLGLVNGISEALEVANGFMTTPRTVGIIILAVAFASVAAVIVVKCVRRRRA